MSRKPIVIGHRGASGHRPEHTLESYALAIAMGADFIEPDLVPTRDGILIARHDNRIDDTTNIVDVVGAGGVPDRRTTKVVDGHEQTGYFTEDYTLAEIKKLRARERIPEIRPRNTAFNDLYVIPTFAEVIALAREHETIGIYPETKHPTFFESETGRDVSAMLVDVLVAEQFADPRRVYIQSFEFANLIRLRREIMPARGVDLPLVQLYGGPSLSPYDMQAHARRGDDLRAIYGELASLVEIHESTSYGDLTSDAVLRFLVASSARAIAPSKNDLLLDDAARDFARRARKLGFDVHPYTFRADGDTQGFTTEIENLLDLGITGFFTDHVDEGRLARDRWWRRRSGHAVSN